MKTFNPNDANWSMFAPTQTKALAIHPNQLWHNNNTNAGALVVTKSSKYEEYAVSKAGIDYMLAADRAQKVTGYVVLLRWQEGKLTVVASKPIAAVAAALADIPPRDGPFGPYWWVRADLTPDGARVLNDDDRPF
jgi:hypothetical protein